MSEDARIAYQSGRIKKRYWADSIRNRSACTLYSGTRILRSGRPGSGVKQKRHGKPRHQWPTATRTLS